MREEEHAQLEEHECPRNAFLWGALGLDAAEQDPDDEQDARGPPPSRELARPRWSQTGLTW